jgi:hypothetical protein
MRMFKNKVLKRIFGPKRDEGTGGWRKLHNEELRNLCSSPNIIRCKDKEYEMGGACSTQGESTLHMVCGAKEISLRATVNTIT